MCGIPGPGGGSKNPKDALAWSQDGTLLDSESAMGTEPGGIALGQPKREAGASFWVVFLLILGLTSVCGGAIVLSATVPGMRHDVERVKNLPQFTVGQLEAAQPGAEAVVIGVLGGTTDTRRYLQRVDSHVASLLTYEHESWRVTEHYGAEDTSPSYDGRWETVDYVVPDAITIDGQGVRVGLAKSFDMGGALHNSDIVVTGMGRQWLGVRAGSIRHAGYNEGDWVSIVGKKGSDGRLVMERVYGGGRDQLVRQLEGVAQFNLMGGAGLLVVGLATWAYAAILVRRAT